jgi:hypothetical protein
MFCVERTRAYYHDPGTTADTLVVFDPSLGRAAGGGWFYWPGTQDRTTFTYSIGHNGGAAPSGNMLVGRRRGNASELFRLRASALIGLSRGTGGEGDARVAWAAFVGRLSDNREFTVYVEDPDAQGAVDRFWIEVRDRDGKRIEGLSFPDGAQTNAVRIQQVLS